MHECVRTCTANGHAIETVLAKETNEMSEPIDFDYSLPLSQLPPEALKNRNGLIVECNGVRYFYPDHDHDEDE